MYIIGMDIIIFHEISIVLLCLIYIPSMIPFVQYILLKNRKECNRNKSKEKLCLTLWLSSIIIFIANVLLLIAID